MKSSTSEDLVCKSCGAPLQPSNEKCDYCGAANPAFAKPKAEKQAVSVPETPYVAPVSTYTSHRINYGQSFFEYSELPGKILLILVVLVALSFFGIASSTSLYNALYQGAGGNDGMGSFVVLLFIIFGPLSGFWALRGFLRLDSGWRAASWFLLIGLVLIHLYFLGVNSPTP